MERMGSKKPDLLPAGATVMLATTLAFSPIIMPKVERNKVSARTQAMGVVIDGLKEVQGVTSQAALQCEMDLDGTKNGLGKCTDLVKTQQQFGETIAQLFTECTEKKQQSEALAEKAFMELGKCRANVTECLASATDYCNKNQ